MSGSTGIEWMSLVAEERSEVLLMAASVVDWFVVRKVGAFAQSPVPKKRREILSERAFLVAAKNKNASDGSEAF